MLWMLILWMLMQVVSFVCLLTNDILSVKLLVNYCTKMTVQKVSVIS